MKMLVKKKEKYCSALAVLIISLIIITPLCGFLFQCGCDWPWSGLDANCNINAWDALHKCPWCTSMIAAVCSAGFAIIAGLYVSTTVKIQSNISSLHAISTRFTCGLLVFFGVAILSAALSALLQGYALGIGSFLI